MPAPPPSSILPTGFGIRLRKYDAHLVCRDAAQLRAYTAFTASGARAPGSPYFWRMWVPEFGCRLAVIVQQIRCCALGERGAAISSPALGALCCTHHDTIRRFQRWLLGQEPDARLDIPGDAEYVRQVVRLYVPRIAADPYHHGSGPPRARYWALTDFEVLHRDHQSAFGDVARGARRGQWTFSFPELWGIGLPGGAGLTLQPPTQAEVGDMTHTDTPQPPTQAEVEPPTSDSGGGSGTESVDSNLRLRRRLNRQPPTQAEVEPPTSDSGGGWLHDSGVQDTPSPPAPPPPPCMHAAAAAFHGSTEIPGTARACEDQPAAAAAILTELGIPVELAERWSRSPGALARAETWRKQLADVRAGMSARGDPMRDLVAYLSPHFRGRCECTRPQCDLQAEYLLAERRRRRARPAAAPVRADSPSPAIPRPPTEIPDPLRGLWEVLLASAGPLLRGLLEEVCSPIRIEPEAGELWLSVRGQNNRELLIARRPQLLAAARTGSPEFPDLRFELERNP